MAVSIMSSVATRGRARLRVEAGRVLRLFAALVFLAPVVAAAEGPPSLDQNSFYLSSAGFRVQVANDPAGQKRLRTLPAHRFVTEGAGDTLRYLYAEPQHCVCIFVGSQQAYDSYRKIVSQPVKPTNNAQPDYKTQAGVLLSGQPLRQSTRGDPTTLSDYLGALSPRY